MRLFSVLGFFVFRASPKTDFALPDLRTPRTWKNRSIVLVGEIAGEIAVMPYGRTDS